MKKLALILPIFVFFSLTLMAQPAVEAYFAPVKWRSIGPFRGGRSVAVSGVPGDPLTYYMGTTGGGLWKTDDAGQYWHNISDGFFQTSSIGAVAVAPSQPHIVYCGTGEHAVRGVMTSHGDGVYKSLDAGKTWKKMGLETTQHIARIVVHPHNPDVLYVAAQGALYGPHKDRGIYKSTDGGTTWELVHYINETTGCGELVMDPSNPSTLYAAMWEYGRKPWKVISGGPGSGLYKSTDAGATWKKIQEGLPEELGKMAITVCASNPDKLYALVESDSERELGGLFVSYDAGKNWDKVSSDHRLVQRAWYYIEAFADPQNENLIYVLSADLLRSIDGGVTWEVMSGPHGDYHDLWINPENPRNMVIADDGGAGITFNRGDSWSTQSNMPTAQIYRVNVDNRFPYRVYGGQQDNTSVVLASSEFYSDGIYHGSWTYSAGGESAFLAFDPDAPRYVMGGSYLGTIEVLDTKAEAGTNIMPAPIQYLALDAKDMRYRYNWNAPIVWDPHEENTYYHAAQVLFRTRDMGQTWTAISPDLTRNEKDKQGKGGGPYTNEAVGAENYGTISYVMVSPHQAGTIWVGSDDGLVHLTRDGGNTWKNVTPANLKECLVNAIEVSPHDPATAYMATTRYKFDDKSPGLYVTHDYGATWTAINQGIPNGAFTRVVREDTERKNLLLAGTETGLYISWNGGNNWQKFSLNLPVTPVTDIAIRHNDVIVSTAGRGFWILDDLALLRQYDPAKGSAMRLFQPEPAMLANSYSELNGNSADFDGTHPLRGVNPANGIVMYYQLQTAASEEELVLEIKDADGQTVRRISSKADGNATWDGGPPAAPVLPAKAGLNRFVWDMRTATRSGVPDVYIEGGYRGHKVPPGVYTLVLSRGSERVTATAEVLANPNYPTTQAEYREYAEYIGAMSSELNEMHRLVNSLREVDEQLSAILEDLPKTPDNEALHETAQQLLDDLRAWDALMVQRKSKAYDDVENFVNGFTADYLFLINQSESDIPRITQPSRQRLAELTPVWAKHKAAAQAFVETRIPALNKMLWEAGVGALRW